MLIELLYELGVVQDFLERDIRLVKQSIDGGDTRISPETPEHIGLDNLGEITHERMEGKEGRIIVVMKE